MIVEYLIAFYMVVSVCMIMFNFGFVVYERTRTARLSRNARRAAVVLGDEIERNTTEQDGEHARVLYRRMRHLMGMEAFDVAMERLEEDDAPAACRYLENVAPIFERLARYFLRKNDLKCAYFAYIVRRWYRKRPASPVMLEVMLHLVRERSFYTRQNAFQALASMEDVRTLVDAVEYLEDGESFHHAKLVTEGLLSFAGDRMALADEVVKRFDRFTPAVQVSIVNFIRMADADVDDAGSFFESGHSRWVCELLCERRTDGEVRLACIRYFARHPQEALAGLLRDLVSYEMPKEWEYAAVAASALSSYPGSETVAVLKRALSSRSWYVRHNAAKSLHDLHTPIEMLQDVLDGPDRYARDMVRYRWGLAGEDLPAPSGVQEGEKAGDAGMRQDDGRSGRRAGKEASA